MNANSDTTKVFLRLNLVIKDKIQFTVESSDYKTMLLYQLTIGSKQATYWLITVNYLPMRNGVCKNFVVFNLGGIRGKVFYQRGKWQLSTNTNSSLFINIAFYKISSSYKDRQFFKNTSRFLLIQIALHKYSKKQTGFYYVYCALEQNNNL